MFRNNFFLGSIHIYLYVISLSVQYSKATALITGNTNCNDFSTISLSFSFKERVARKML